MINNIFCFAIIFVAEAYIANVYYDMLLKPKIRASYKRLAFVVAYITLFVIGSFASPLINLIAFSALNLSTALYCYEGKFHTILFFTALLVMTMMVGEQLVIISFQVTGAEYHSFLNSFSMLVKISIVSKLIYFFLALLLAVILSVKQHRNIARGAKLIIGIAPLVSIVVIMGLAYISAASEAKSVEIVSISAIICLMLLNTIITLIGHNMLLLDGEVFILSGRERIDELEKKYYQSLEKQLKEQQMLIHDVKAHFNTVNQLARTSDNYQLVEYLESYKKQPILNTNTVFSNNTVLDAVLSDYEAKSRERGTKFNCDARKGSLEFMDDLSITTLMSNLLSNALEAAEKSNGKWIDVYIRKYPIPTLTIENSCDIAPRLNANGHFLPDKKKGKNHGFGAGNIERVVKQYNGISSYTYDSDIRRVQCTIVFPDALEQ